MGFAVATIVEVRQPRRLRRKIGVVAVALTVADDGTTPIVKPDKPPDMNRLKNQDEERLLKVAETITAAR